MIVGKSVHNQRIERMWRGVYEGVVGFYHSLFNHMESVNILDADNDMQIFSLHMVFIPRINKHLQSWQRAWVKHPLRTEQNLSPEQLWIVGLQRIAASAHHIAREVFEDLSEVIVHKVFSNYCQYVFAQEEGCDFGIDWGGPVPHDSDDRE